MEDVLKIINPRTLEGEPLLEGSESENSIFSEITVDSDGLFDNEIDVVKIDTVDKGLTETLDGEDPYVERGYKDRRDYLKGLADEYGVQRSVVFGLASALGQDEDFDMLVSEVVDYASTHFADDFSYDDGPDPKVSINGVEDTVGNYLCSAYLTKKYDISFDSRWYFKESDVIAFILEQTSKGHFVTVENTVDNTIMYFTPEKYYDGVIRTSELIDTRKKPPL